MTSSGLSPDVQCFLHEHIDSVEQLEVLLLLVRTAPEVWSSELVAQELRVAASSASQRLEHLARRGLLRHDVGYWYDQTLSLDHTIKQVSVAYRERRVAVIGQIFSKPHGSKAK